MEHKAVIGCELEEKVFFTHTRRAGSFNLFIGSDWANSQLLQCSLLSTCCQPDHKKERKPSRVDLGNKSRTCVACYSRYSIFPSHSHKSEEKKTTKKLTYFSWELIYFYM